MDSDKLTISLLGPPVINFRGKAIRIQRRKVRYLLYYLACQETPVTRANLCDLFWPDCDENEARKNLRETLSNLRNAFRMESYLAIRGEFISLDTDKVVVDVRDFERVIEMIRKIQGISTGVSFTDATYLSIRDGVQLWRGPGFLGNVLLEGSEAFQKWASEKNADLEYWRQVMLEWLADHCITLGNLNEALQWLNLALKNDKQNTELNLLTLNCLRDLGVSKEIEHFCAVLELVYQENGLSTLPQVLKDAITRAREASNLPAQNKPVLWKDTDPYRVHYVDSNRRMDRLKKRLQKGGMVLLRGENGLGKSRLLKEFYNSLEVIPRLVYHCSTPGEESIPYQALVDGFKKITSEEEWRALDSIYAKTLYPLFPFLVDIRSDLKTDDLSLAIGLKRLLPEAFLMLFFQVAQQRRVLFILDDAQWCDAETLQVLAYVHEQGGPEEVGMAILAAGVEVNNTALDRMFARFSANYFVDEVEIPPLSRDEISEITYLVFGEKPSSPMAAWLDQESGGNPGLLIDLLNSLREAGVLQLDECLQFDSYWMNPALQLNIQRRIKELSKREQQLLEMAAVIGQTFSPAVFKSVCGESLETVEKELQRFTEKYFLRIKDNETYEFVHGVVRRWLLDQLSPARRQLFHQKTIDSLIQNAGNTLENALVIARHYDAIKNLSGAFDYWLRAGDLARKAYAPELVNSAYGRAFELCELMGERCNSTDYYRLIRSWSDFTLDSGDLETSRSIFSTAMKEGKKRSDQRLIGFVESSEALLEAISGNFDVAQKFIDQSIEHLSQLSFLENYARAYALRGVINVLQGQFSTAVKDFDQVYTLTRDGDETGLDALRAFCAPYLICAYCGLGKLNEANDYFVQALQEARLSNLPNYLVIIQACAGILFLAEGEYSSSLEAIHVLDLTESGFAVAWWKDVLKIVKAYDYLELGELNLCWKILDNFTKQYDGNLKYGALVAYANVIQAEIYFRLGDDELASRYYEKCFALTKNEFAKLFAEFGMNICRNTGNVERQKALLGEVLARSDSNGYRLFSNIVKIRSLVLFGEELSGDFRVSEVDQVKQQLQQEGLTGHSTELPVVEEVVVHLDRSTAIDLAKVRVYLDKVGEGGSFWIKLYGLSEVLARGSDAKLLTKERRNFRQLLERLMITNAGEVLEPAVKKFVEEKQQLLKA